MKTDTDILNYLQNLAPPAMVSSDVRIKALDHHLVIGPAPIPLKAISIWMGVVYVLAVGAVYWSDPDSLVLILPLGLLSVLFFLAIMTMIAKVSAAAGPYATIAADIRNYEGSILEKSKVTRIIDVFHRKSRSRNRYRTVLLEADHQLYPILWQFTTNHPWVRPKLDMVARVLKVRIDKVVIRLK